MKPSHFTTPRTMSDCGLSATNVEPMRDESDKPMDVRDAAVLWGCVIAVVCLAVILIVQHVQEKGIPLP